VPGSLQDQLYAEVARREETEKALDDEKKKVKDLVLALELEKEKSKEKFK